MNNKYEIEWDESGLYVARNHLMPGVFLEALTPQELDEQIALAEIDLINIRSDHPALRSRHVDLVRLTLVDQRFVNRGMGSGEYEIWAKGNVFLTVPAPIQAKRTPAMIFGFIFELWKRQSPS